MNRLQGEIVAVESVDGVTLVDVAVGGVGLTALLIGALSGAGALAAARALATGQTVTLGFQEAEVSLARELAGTISLRNALPCTVTRVERGRLLSQVTLDFQGTTLASIVTTRSADRLALAPGVEVTALVKANEMAIV
ncbi:TOBE domain-containing protein [Crenobacter cavernae]|uniref:Mop domain-containing protein n=1 Tax=Crenobacter cavernae TaxID=2290923 RepID=A0ABY0FF64_9NEIS|nr:TOBE domain-containing protein [Crenobacter cavernae]RXZ44885.1 hypothetical protein EBB06_03050 [Crenobacter cavernae]